MAASFIYITAADKTEALKIGRTLVEERLIACANVFDNMTSVYWWEGKIEDSGEAVLIAKTKESLVDAITERVKQLHSYSCPCVVALPIQNGNPEYLSWIDSETR